MRGIMNFFRLVRDKLEEFQSWKIDREEEKLALMEMDAEHEREMTDLTIEELKCKADVDKAEAKLAEAKSGGGHNA